MKTLIRKFVCLAVLLTLCVQSPAGAHAFPDHSNPKVGQELLTAPKEIRIWFDDDIKPGQSSIEVFDKNLKRVDRGDSHGDPKDATLLIVSLAKLPAGTYKVVWKATCLQDHLTSGDFKFTVKPAASTRPEK